MAINTQKLLSPGKLSPAERMAAAYDKKIDDLLNIKIKKKLINVDKVFNKTKKVKEKTRKEKKTREENEARKKRENRLEQKQPQGATKLSLPNLPRTGFLDSVQNFIGYTFLGYLMTTYYDKLPALMGVAKILPPALETFGAIIRTTFNIGTSLIEGGYKFREDLSQKTKELGGEDAQKTFDEASDSLKNVVNSILTLGLYQAPKKEKEPIPQKNTGGYVKKMAPGGNVTRAGKPTGGAVSRQIQKVESRKIPVLYRQQIQPGKDIGGRKKIEMIFPSSPKRDEPGPLNTLMNTSSELSSVPFVGPLMSAAIGIALGQKPDRRIYATFGESLAYMLKPSIDAQSNTSINSIVSMIASMAEGGAITRGITKKRTNTEELGFSLARIFQNSVESRLSRIFSQILKTKVAESAGGGVGGFAAGAPEYVSPEEIYEYLKSKGLSHNHIMGMLANIQAESSFDAGAIGDSGTSGGLFQHHAERFSGMTSFAGKNWRKEWKKQVDYALREKSGREYASIKFNTPEEASKWFTLNFERPSDAERKAIERLANLKNFGPGGTLFGARSREGIKVTSRFGEQRGREKHYGTDIAANLGTPLKALTDGEVIDTGYESGWGNFLIFRDSNGLYHLYGHMQNKAKLGKVKKGAIIGKVGITGRTSGPHLHWEAGTSWDKYQLENKIDPLNIPGYNQYSPFTTEQKVDLKKIKPQKEVSVGVQPPPSAEVAESRPRVSNTAQQLAMSPSYDSGKEVVFVLLEKIAMMDQNSPINFPSKPQSIQNLGLNSRVPTSVG